MRSGEKARNRSTRLSAGKRGNPGWARESARVTIDRLAAIADSFAVLDGLFLEVFPVAREDVEVARQVAERRLGLSGRDCLHLAVMIRRGIGRILTLDTGFEAYPGIERLPRPGL